MRKIKVTYWYVTEADDELSVELVNEIAKKIQEMANLETLVPWSIEVVKDKKKKGKDK